MKRNFNILKSVAITGILTLSVILTSCDDKKVIEQTFLQKENAKSVDMELLGDTTSFLYTINSRIIEEGVTIYTLKLESEVEKNPNEMKLHWRMPSADICGQWTTQSYKHKFLYPEWSGYANVTSKAASNSPVICLYGNMDFNRLTFACSDALNTITLHSGIKEEDGFFDCEVILFKEKTPAIKEYQIDVLVDTRNIHFSDALKDVSQWWEQMPEYKPMVVPDNARLPMYSSWYSFHQNLVVEEVLEQCKLAKELGYESIIIDDGWQTKDNSRGYAFTGDWDPERIPEFKEFVDEVHEIGMKFILWYSVPYIGEKSDNYSQFKGKYLNYWGGKWGGSYTLDPRYPEVREFLIKTYVDAIEKWDIDGFKLDFIDSFFPKEDTELTAEDGRDYASVNDAVDRLMTDVTEELKKVKPDVLIEFRQSYIGPLMRKYGNMFRAGDCPNSYHYNRVRIADLRLLSGNTAVHSDMVMWHPQESVESAALQLIHVIFSVPQLSVKIDKVPEDHKEMIKFWNSYWRENREVLLDGDFRALNPAMNYSQMSSSLKDKKIIAVYSNELVNLGNAPSKVEIINGKLQSGVLVNVDASIKKGEYKTFDCKGNETSKGKLTAGLQLIDVPAAGLIRIGY